MAQEWHLQEPLSLVHINLFLQFLFQHIVVFP